MYIVLNLIYFSNEDEYACFSLVLYTMIISNIDWLYDIRLTESITNNLIAKKFTFMLILHLLFTCCLGLFHRYLTQKTSEFHILLLVEVKLYLRIQEWNNIHQFTEAHSSPYYISLHKAKPRVRAIFIYIFESAEDSPQSGNIDVAL